MLSGLTIFLLILIIYIAIVMQLKSRGLLEKWGVVAVGPLLMLRTDRGNAILDRIAARIPDAVHQFDAVNPDLGHPNVLAFVNRNRMCDSPDLFEVVTGHRLFDGGGAAPIGLRWSEGRIHDEKWRVHLYLWVDCFGADQIFFNTVDRRHLDRLAAYLAIDPKSISDDLPRAPQRDSL